MATIDYSKPLATLLREGTHEAHELVAKSEGAKLLLSGGMSKGEYVRYLMMLWHVYDVLETNLARYATEPALETTYNSKLARAQSLSEDISFLLQVNEDSWKAHPIHVKLIKSSLTPLEAYTRRIEEVSKSSDPTPLLAHSYVRYLGDLSGGQTARRVIAKAYGLADDNVLDNNKDIPGVRFYAFESLRSSQPANQGEMKRIKEWFREGLNAAGEQDIKVKMAVVEEAKRAFELNAGLFEVLDINSAKVEKDLLTEEEEKETLPATQKTYPLAQVIAVIAAVCLSHFILTVGGFTGDRGYQKLLAIEEWFATIGQQASN